MFRTRSFLLLLILLLSLSWLSTSGLVKRTRASAAADHRETYPVEPNTLAKAREKAAEARKFIQRKGFNNQICFLIDMSLPSGHNRFFVYDLKKDSLQNSGLVTHGNCYQTWLEGRKYGNIVGCGCTSLGKYKIGYSYFGNYGLAFKLHGLDSTNNKAFQRYVVLHGHECVPETEVADEICQSNGCPTVSPNFLLQLKPMITESKQPVLLWIYE
jgi:hypothetical protein